MRAEWLGTVRSARLGCVIAWWQLVQRSTTFIEGIQIWSMSE